MATIHIKDKLAFAYSNVSGKLFKQTFLFAYFFPHFQVTAIQKENGARSMGE